MYKRLAMGHVYAVAVLMVLNFQLINTLSASRRWAGRVTYLNQAAALAAGVCLQVGELAVYLHVDDFGILAGDDASGDEFAYELAELSGSLGSPPSAPRGSRSSSSLAWSLSAARPPGSHRTTS